MLKLGNYLLCGWLLAAWCGSAAAGVQAVPDRDSSVYAPGEAVRFAFRPDGAERIVCRVLDFDRKTVREAALKAGEELRLDTLENGYYDLEFEAFDAAGKRTGRGSWPFAVIPEVDRSKLDWTRNQFGAMVMPHTAYPLADRKRDAEMMSRIGIRFVRTQRLSWIQIQPDENRPPDWTMSDRETEIYLDNHLAIVANTGWPLQLWASSGRGSGMRNPDKMFPAGDRMEQLKSFYTELAKRYRGRIAYWEVGNEVDAALFWLGRPENAAAGNKDAILKDFCDYYTVVARAIRAGDPEAKIGPNTTGAAPDGHTYRDWLRKFLSDPEANREMDFFSSHYRCDIPAIRNVFAEKGKAPETDVIVTEIGGMAHVVGRTIPTWREKKSNIRVTYIQCGAAWIEGGKALCKFLLRDIPNIPPQAWIAGMLEKDFKLRPEYVAYATLIREFGNAVPAGELNVVRRSGSGWLQCFSGDTGAGKVNLLILNDAGRARITLDTSEETLLLVDPMGRERRLAAADGKVSFEMTSDVPLFLRGRITPDPGPVEYPKPVVAKVYRPEVNGGFEKKAELNRIPGWRVITDEVGGRGGRAVNFRVETDRDVKFSGKQSLRMHAERKSGWYGVMCVLPAEALPKPGPGEYLELAVRYRLRAEKVAGTGTAVTFSLREKNLRRVSWSDSAFEWGSFDWEMRGKRARYDRLPENFGSLTVEFYLGQATGTVWIDDVEITATLYRQPGADARGIN